MTCRKLIGKIYRHLRYQIWLEDVGKYKNYEMRLCNSPYPDRMQGCYIAIKETK